MPAFALSLSCFCAMDFAGLLHLCSPIAGDVAQTCADALVANPVRCPHPLCMSAPYLPLYASVHGGHPESAQILLGSTFDAAGTRQMPRPLAWASQLMPMSFADGLLGTYSFEAGSFDELGSRVPWLAERLCFVLGRPFLFLSGWCCALRTAALLSLGVALLLQGFQASQISACMQ